MIQLTDRQADIIRCRCLSLVNYFESRKLTDDEAMDRRADVLSIWEKIRDATRANGSEVQDERL